MHMYYIAHTHTYMYIYIWVRVQISIYGWYNPMSVAICTSFRKFLNICVSLTRCSLASLDTWTLPHSRPPPCCVLSGRRWILAHYRDLTVTEDWTIPNVFLVLKQFLSFSNDGQTAGYPWKIRGDQDKKHQCCFLGNWTVFWGFIIWLYI